jgi:hypothetical protein
MRKVAKKKRKRVRRWGNGWCQKNINAEICVKKAQKFMKNDKNILKIIKKRLKPSKKHLDYV